MMAWSTTWKNNVLSTVLSRLNSATNGFEVIAEAPTGAAITTIDAATASAALKTLLAAAVTNAYAVEIPEGKTPTDAVYRLVSARPVEVDDVRVITAVTFVVTVRATTYANLMTAIGNIETQVTASSDAISITDAALDFDDNKNYFLAGIEVVYAVPAVAGGSNWPALLVDVQGFEAGGELYDNFVKQRVQRGYGFMLVSTTNNIATLRTDLQGALLGWQQAATDNPFNYQAGAPVKLPGGLYAWRDIYFDSGYISE